MRFLKIKLMHVVADIIPTTRSKFFFPHFLFELLFISSAGGNSSIFSITILSLTISPLAVFNLNVNLNVACLKSKPSSLLIPLVPSIKIFVPKYSI